MNRRTCLRGFVFAALLLVGAYGMRGACQANAPKAPGITVPVSIIEVVDGDTVTVEAKITARVRLLDCWSPELNAPGGREARDAMVMLAEGEAAMLHVPIPLDARLDRIFSFGRVLGRITVDGRDIGEAMIVQGHAWRTKQELRNRVKP